MAHKDTDYYQMREAMRDPDYDTVKKDTRYDEQQCNEVPKEPNKNGLPSGAKARKTYPIATGVLDYFPDALAEVSHVSFVGNEQHNPGTPLHWDRSKSTDEADALMRHMIQRGTSDVDGIRHSAKVAWRALAMLQKEIENDGSKSKG